MFIVYLVALSFSFSSGFTRLVPGPERLHLLDHVLGPVFQHVFVGGVLVADALKLSLGPQKLVPVICHQILLLSQLRVQFLELQTCISR